MCGLLGFISLRAGSPGNILLSRSFVEKGMYILALRGVQGTGIAAVRHTGTPGSFDYYKNAFPSSYFLALPPFAYIKSNIDSYRYLMAHVRAATTGMVNADNAHPFKAGNVILAHNGVIKNTWDLKHKHKFEVDSELVAMLLDETSPEEASKSVLEKLEGSYVLTWVDRRDNSFNIARNAQRPLFGSISDNKETLYYMSEREMLSLLATHCDNGSSLNNIFEFKSGVHYKYFDTGAGVETTFTPFVPEVKQVTYYGRDNHWNSGRAGKTSVELAEEASSNFTTPTTDIVGPENVASLTKISGVHWGKGADKTDIHAKNWIDFTLKKYETTRGGRILGTIDGVNRLVVVAYSPDLDKVTLATGQKLLACVSSIFQGGTTENPVFYVFVTRTRNKEGYAINGTKSGLIQTSKGERLQDCDFCNNPVKQEDLVKSGEYSVCQNCISNVVDSESKH